MRNAGIGASEGQTPDSVATMAYYAVGFLNALESATSTLSGLPGRRRRATVLADRPGLIRKAILVGTGAAGCGRIENLPNIIAANAKESAETKVPLKALLFFTSTPEGRQAGIDFVKRIDNRTVDPEPVATQEAIQAQAKAYVTWGLSQRIAPNWKPSNNRSLS